MVNSRILLVLRGRPGLGHVTPSLAIAFELEKLGYEIHVLTYNSGFKFLNHSRFKNLYQIIIQNDYEDYGGLFLYPHGVKIVAPIISKIQPVYILFGGEYFLTPLLEILKIKGGLVFNEETFNKPTHSKIAKEMLLFHFSLCNQLFSMSEVSQLFKDLIANKVRKDLIEGEFVIQQTFDKEATKIILIANGGGCNFPTTTVSYSQNEITPDFWKHETFEFTDKSIEYFIKYRKSKFTIYVFSAIDETTNNILKEKYALVEDVIFYEPSLQFYSLLNNANIIISRAGMGFISDINNLNCPIIIWALTGHDEQEGNASNISAQKNNVTWCRRIEDLEKVIVEGLRDVETIVATPNVKTTNSLFAAQKIHKLINYENCIE